MNGIHVSLQFEISRCDGPVISHLRVSLTGRILGTRSRLWRSGGLVVFGQRFLP